MLKKYEQKDNREKVTEIIHKMESVADNGIGTVQQFLAISKEGYLKEVHSEPVNIMAALALILEQSGCENKIKVSLKQSDFDTISIQPKVFESIFVNLLTNSIKYCEKSPKCN